MSQQDLQKCMPEILAIPEAEVKSPAYPVAVFIQEAEDQKVWAIADKDLLINAGLDWSIVESIPERAGACREAQSVWAKEFKSQEEAEKEWAKKSPAAFKLRDSLLNAFRYAFRKDDVLLAKVSAIAEGTSREDMIQDLNDLSVLGRENTPLLQSIKFDLARLDMAATMTSEMAELLAGAKTGKDTKPKELDIRDKAYTYLKQAVDELRSCGKYVFNDDDDRLKGYRSTFLSKKNKKSREKDIEEETKNN